MTTRPLADALTVATTTTAGVMAAADKAKLDGVQNGATANDQDGALRDRSTHTGTQPASTISDLPESVQDIVAAALTAGTGVTITYDDTAGTITITATVDNEAVDDRVAALLAAGSNVTLTYDDVANTLTIAATVDNETIDDRVAALIQAGANVTVTYDDVANTLTIAASIPNETIDDRVAALLVAGTNITLTYDDVANTLTIASTASGSGGHIIQDEGTALTARANLNFVGAGVTVTDDAANDRTVVTIPGGSGGTATSLRIPFGVGDALMPASASPVNTHRAAVYGAVTMQRFSMWVYVNGTNDASNYWRFDLLDDTGTVRATVNTSTGAAATYLDLTTIAFPAGATVAESVKALNVLATKVGNPGSFYAGVELLIDGTAANGANGLDGAWTQISETVLASAQPSVSFNDILGNYRAVVIHWQAGNDAASGVMGMQLNGDTGANYNYTNRDNSTSGAVSSNQSSFRVGILGGSTQPANLATSGEIVLHNYSGGKYKNIRATSARLDDLTTLFESNNTGYWASTAPVTSITLVPPAGNFTAGSVFTLYGIDEGAPNGAVTPRVMAVHKNSVNQGSLTAGAFNKVTWSTKEFDTHNTFDTITGRWTPGKVGRYAILAALQGDGGTSGAYLSVYKNGVRLRDSTESINGSGFNLGLQLATIVTVDAITDYFEIYHYPGGNTVVAGDPVRTYWQGTEIVQGIATGGPADAVTTGTTSVTIPGLVASADIASSGGAGTSEEYNTTTHNLTWWPTTPATVNSNTTLKSHLYVASTAAAEHFGLKPWVPASSAFDVRTVVEAPQLVAGGAVYIDLVVSNAAINSFVMLLTERAINAPNIAVKAYTFNGAYTQYGPTVTMPLGKLYLRITRDASNNISYYVSTSGLEGTWVLIVTQAYTFTAERVGYRFNSGSTSEHTFISDWLRTSN